VGPFDLADRAFDSNVIDLPVIVLALSLGIKIAVRTSGDCEDCVVGGERVGLLQRFLNLRLRLIQWVSFSFDLGIGIVWRWVCDLWHWRGGMLFVELAKVVDGWLWRNGMIGMPEVGFGCFDKLAVEKVKYMMDCIVGGEEPIAWCG
jgi:hypothetical protein